MAAFPVDAIAESLARLRAATPRVHCITNSVAQPLTANGLLALGAVPSLTINRREIADFAAGADALLVNLGTLDDERIAAIETALEVVGDAGRGFVLDPVFIDVSPVRCDYAKALIGHAPAAIRLNGKELSALSAASTPELAAAARDWKTALAVTGAVDRITDGHSHASLAHGHALMARVTAMGCLASAVIAAFLPVTDSPLKAAVAGISIVGLAGEIAGETAAGPGTFQTHFIDALAALTPQTLKERLVIRDEDF